MTRRRVDDDATWPARNVHSVDGRIMPCCEEGELDCPCVCHEPALKLRPEPALKLRPVDPPPEAA